MFAISPLLHNEFGEDLLKLSEIIHSSVSCKTQNEVCSIVSQLQRICGFNSAFLALIKGSENTGYQATSWINHSYPVEWLEIYQRENFAAIDPVFLTHSRNPETRQWQDIYAATPPSKRFLSAAKDHGLCDGWTTGLPNQERDEASLMSFSWSGHASELRGGALLHFAAPHLHQALVRSLGIRQLVPPGDALTPKESEVLTWIKRGKSNWEIAQIVKSSERTVKFHVGNVLSKLGAANRGHAVAIAIENCL